MISSIPPKYANEPNKNQTFPRSKQKAAGAADDHSSFSHYSHPLNLTGCTQQCIPPYVDGWLAVVTLWQEAIITNPDDDTAEMMLLHFIPQNWSSFLMMFSFLNFLGANKWWCRHRSAWFICRERRIASPLPPSSFILISLLLEEEHDHQ